MIRELSRMGVFFALFCVYVHRAMRDVLCVLSVDPWSGLKGLTREKCAGNHLNRISARKITLSHAEFNAPEHEWMPTGKIVLGQNKNSTDTRHLTSRLHKRPRSRRAHAHFHLDDRDPCGSLCTQAFHRFSQAHIRFLR